MGSKRAAGFTLVELVVVILILGVLAVTAIPRFFDIAEDARAASIESLSASVVTAAEQAFIQAKINNVEKNSRSSPNNPPSVDVGFGTLELKYGYPEARPEEGLGILDLVELDEEWEICFSTGCISSNSSRVKIGFDTTEDEGCYVKYIEPGGTGNPSDTKYAIEVEKSGC